MNWLGRMFGRKPREERRAVGDLFSLGFGQYYGGTVSAREAEAAATVTACVELLTGAVSSLPAELVQDTENGSVPVPPTNPAWRVIRKPNPWQTWPEYASWSVAQYLLHGNSASWIVDDARGALAQLVPLPWSYISPLVIDGSEGPRLIYDVVQSSPETVLHGVPRRLAAEDVLHIRNRGDNGLIGRSVLSRAPGPVLEAIEIQTIAYSNWKNGLRPSAVLRSPTFLQEAQRDRFDDTWMAKFSGALATGRTPLLEGGWSIERAALTSVDAEFHAMRQHSVADVCRLFKIPEQLLQPANRSVADLTPYISTFATLAVLPIVTAIEAGFSAILPSNLRLQLNVDGLLRGSFSQATSAICAATQSGILTVNDARTALGWPEIEGGGDQFVRRPAPSYPPDFAGSTAMHPSPGPTGDTPSLPSHENEGRPKPNGKAH
jgi:HK97 family phage portal protein